MKTLTLPETRIKLEVPDSFYYHDDGLVSSLDVQTAKLEKQYNLRVNLITHLRKHSVKVDP